MSFYDLFQEMDDTMKHVFPLLVAVAFLSEAQAEDVKRNIPYIDVLPNAGLNVYDILRARKLVLTQDAVNAIHERFKKDGETKTAAPKKRAAKKTEEGAAA